MSKVGNLDFFFLFSQGSVVGPVFPTILTTSYRYMTNTSSAVSLCGASPSLCQVSSVPPAVHPTVDMLFTRPLYCSLSLEGRVSLRVRLWFSSLNSQRHRTEQHRLCKFSGWTSCELLNMAAHAMLHCVLLEVRPSEVDTE